MKLINQTKRCSSCGCISFPDSRSCPKCGKSHVETSLVKAPQPAVENMDYCDVTLRDLVALNQNIIINIRDNITISITDRQLVQITP